MCTMYFSDLNSCGEKENEVNSLLLQGKYHEPVLFCAAALTEPWWIAFLMQVEVQLLSMNLDF